MLAALPRHCLVTSKCVMDTMCERILAESLPFRGGLLNSSFSHGCMGTGWSHIESYNNVRGFGK